MICPLSSCVLYLFSNRVAKMMRVLVAALGLVLLASPVASHELLIYTVIVNSDGAQPADIPNGSLKEGDTVWFWMKDSTENTTLVVEIEKDGAKVRSPVLQFECELDDNGSMVDEDCVNRFDFVFNQHNSAGQWNFTFMKYVNEALNETSTGSVYITEDVHEEEPIESDTESKELSKQAIAGIIAVISLFAIAILATKINEENSSEEE